MIWDDTKLDIDPDSLLTRPIWRLMPKTSYLVSNVALYRLCVGEWNRFLGPSSSRFVECYLRKDTVFLALRSTSRRNVVDCFFGKASLKENLMELHIHDRRISSF